MLYLIGIGAGIAAGYLAGGRLKRLAANVRLGWLWILYGALGAQVWLALGPGGLPSGDERFAVLLGSYALLVMWLAAVAASHPAWLKVAFATIAAGTALNLVAIAPNRGIPVSEAALERADVPIPAETANRFAVKHVLAGPDTVFNVLGDVIPIPPMRDVISIGDILIVLGVGSVLVAGMRMKPRERPVVAPPEIVSQPQPESSPTAPRRLPPALDGLAPFALGGQAYEAMTEGVRHPRESRVVLSQAMSITDANLAGNVHGGVIMKLVDTAAGLAAIKHAHGRVVTVSMDEMSFIEPVFLSDVVTLMAQVNDVGRTSMEVGVRVEAENSVTAERRHVSSAYLVFVALDNDGKPAPVPRLEPETDEERRRMEDAKIRRRHRIARKEALIDRRRAENVIAESHAPAAPSQPRGAEGAAAPGDSVPAEDAPPPTDVPPFLTA